MVDLEGDGFHWGGFIVGIGGCAVGIGRLGA
jgi:hypothetical protein